MKKERMRILDLLEQGKITAAEATNLLEALKAQVYEFDSDDCDCMENIDDKLNNFSKTMDSFAKDLYNKVGGAFKDVEPRVKNVTKGIIAKTADIMDDISKTLNETIKNMDGNCCCNDAEENPNTEQGCCCAEEKPNTEQGCCCAEEKPSTEQSCCNDDKPHEN